MNTIEKKIFKNIKSQGPLDFPGLKIAALLGGRKIVDMSYGKTWDFYDLASLTKILFTTSAFMKMEEGGKNLVSQKVQSFLPWYKYPRVTIKQLLSHSAGYDWWQPFYKSIDKEATPEEKFGQLIWEVRKAPLASSRKKAVYSDLDFFVLGALLEKIQGLPLIEVWNRFYGENLSHLNFHFNYDNKLLQKKSSYAPTEKCPWRKKILQGEAHDDNTWALGGVAPHAGLFGTMKDMVSWGRSVRSALFGGSRFLSTKVLKQFTKRSMPAHQGDWGLGFMMPSKGRSTAGSLFSPFSFGHTGFTGTSFWLDPKRDLMVILLSNRVYKSRQNKDFISLRPQIHDWIVQEVER